MKRDEATKSFEVAPQHWRDLVVLVAGSPWNGLQFASHHVARALTAYVPVLYVEPPLSRLSVIRHPQRRSQFDRPRLRMVEPSIACVLPVTQPWPYRVGSRLMTERIVRHTIARTVDILGGDALAVLAFDVTSRVFGAAHEAVSVYYSKDDFSAAGALTGRSGTFLAAREQWMADHADIVVAHSPRLVERWERYAPVFIPNGVDPECFAHVDDAPLPPDVTLPRPITGFIGNLSQRFDHAILEAIAARGHSLLLVGPRQRTFDLDELQGLLDRPNVQWVGAKAYEELPSYLRTIDVGIVPYTRSAFNEASFPLKTLEYLAAGRPAVSTDLPASRWLDTELVAIENDPARFADRVEDAFAAAAQPEVRDACRAFARRHSWAQRVEVLADRLELTRRPGPGTDRSDIATKPR